MPKPLHLLSPADEIRYLREVLRVTEPSALLDRITDGFHVLQARSSMLLSLVALCLTISGFSGHRIVEAGLVPAILLSIGLCLAVGSSFLLLAGPLQIRWVTRRSCGENLDETLVALLSLRNRRTTRYHQAALLLVVGLASYVASLISFLLQAAR